MGRLQTLRCMSSAGPPMLQVSFAMRIEGGGGGEKKSQKDND